MDVSVYMFMCICVHICVYINMCVMCMCIFCVSARVYMLCGVQVCACPCVYFVVQRLSTRI